MSSEAFLLLLTVITRLMELLTPRGVLVQEMGQTCLAEPDADGEEVRALRPLQAVAITQRFAFDPRAGRQVLSLRGAMPRKGTVGQPLCVDIDGFGLHAAVRVEANERKRLEDQVPRPRPHLIRFGVCITALREVSGPRFENMASGHPMPGCGRWRCPRSGSSRTKPRVRSHRRVRDRGRPGAARPHQLGTATQVGHEVPRRGRSQQSRHRQVTSPPNSGLFKTRGTVAFRQARRGTRRSDEEVEIFRGADRVRTSTG